MKYICIDTFTGKIVPFVDTCGNPWNELLTLHWALRAIAGMNREAGCKTRYRVEAL